MVEAVGKYTYLMRLRDSMRIHPVFKVSLLMVASHDPFLKKASPSPIPEIVNRKEEYEVDEVLNAKTVPN